MSDTVTTYLDRLSVSTTAEGRDRKLSIDLPWPEFETVRVDIEIRRHEPWDRLQAYIDVDPFSETRYRDAREHLNLSAALSVLGLSERLPRFTSGQRLEGMNLLATSLEGHLGRLARGAEMRAVRNGLMRRVAEAGFDVNAEIDLDAIRLLEYASDVEPETYELAFRLRPEVAAACEAFPMLAYEILTSASVNEASFDGDVAALLKSGGLDRSLSRGHPVEPMEPHVVAWLRGLRIQATTWTQDAIDLMVEYATPCDPMELPRSAHDLDAFWKAGGIAYDAFVGRDYPDEDFQPTLREYLEAARPDHGSGEGWAGVLPLWRSKLLREQGGEICDGLADHRG